MPMPANGWAAKAEAVIEIVSLLVVVALLLIYLVFALLRPEKF
jgi:K+-transporting ATPase KdpF subunit